jgi:hypothetical protein
MRRRDLGVPELLLQVSDRTAVLGLARCDRLPTQLARPTITMPYSAVAMCDDAHFG